MTNQIRNDEGTGHGRTLPTAVTPEIAMTRAYQLMWLEGPALRASEQRGGTWGWVGLR
jgi:hypothetical protein